MGSGTKNKNKHQNQDGKKLKKKDRRLNAKSANKFDLYQRSVNSPDTDVDFLERVWDELRDRPLLHMREDFCGTAALPAEFLKRDEKPTA